MNVEIGSIVLYFFLFLGRNDFFWDNCALKPVSAPYEFRRVPFIMGQIPTIFWVGVVLFKLPKMFLASIEFFAEFAYGNLNAGLSIQDTAVFF